MSFNLGLEVNELIRQRISRVHILIDVHGCQDDLLGTILMYEGLDPPVFPFENFCVGIANTDLAPERVYLEVKNGIVLMDSNFHVDKIRGRLLHLFEVFVALGVQTSTKPLALRG